MFRTQIYLTEQEKSSLDVIARETGSSQSALIRKAIDKFISNYSEDDKNLLSAFGVWKDYNFDYRELRNESDRDFS